MKGQRVHKCEHLGCNKVFTRAEHRRRHELTHTIATSYNCAYKGCTRKYKRATSLIRHQKQCNHQLPERNDPISTGSSKLTKPDQQHDLLRQHSHTTDVLSSDIEDFSGLFLDLEHSSGESFMPKLLESGTVSANLDIEPSFHTIPLQEPTSCPRCRQPSPSVCLETTIYRCLRKLLRPDAFKAPEFSDVRNQQEEMALFDYD